MDSSIDEYLVSDKGKFAFKFLKKNGSNTIQQIILLYENKLPKLKYLTIQKIDRQTFPECKYIRKTSFPDDYKVFACIRNPYSRVATQFLQDPWYRRTMNFYGFLKGLPHDDDTRIMSYKDLLKNLPSRTKFFRFETFNESLKEILEELNVGIKIPHVHKNKINSQKYNPYFYKKYYKPKHMEIMKEYFKWDLEKFNYTFDTYGDLPQMKDLF